LSGHRKNFESVSTYKNNVNSKKKGERTMKKVVSLLLALALVFGTMSFALAVPADVVGTEYEEVATKLGALGLMIGDDRGFRPNDSITRAEFATIVVRALGLEAAAKFSTTPTKFTDVTEDHKWAWGYINVATEQGVIIGYGDGKFGPMDPVTYEQAITMLVRALGYEPAVVGGYPAGYLAKAAELDITDDVKVVAGAGAPRGAVAQMLDNSLEVDLMMRETFGDSAEYKAQAGKNLLKDKIGVEIKTGIVNKVNEDDKEITIGSDKYDVADGVVIAGLKDAEVEAWKLGGKIVYISVESTVVYDEVDDIDDNGTPGDATDDIVKLSRTGNEYTIDTSVYTGLAVGEFAKFVVNDDNEVISVTEYAFNRVNNGIVKEVGDDYIKYQRVNGSTDDTTIKLKLDKADSIVVVIDGKLAELGDIDEDSLLYVSESSDDYFIYVSTKKVEGEFERAKSDEIRVDGEYYDLVSTTKFYSTDGGEDFTSTDKTSDLLGEEVTVYMNYAGKVVLISGEVEEDTSSFYAIVVGVDTSGFEDKVKVVNDAGEVVVYELDSAVTLDPATDVNKVYKFTVDEDNIITAAVEKVANVKDTGTALAALDDDYDTITIGTNVYYVTDDTKIFVTEDYTTDIDDIVVKEWSEIEETDNATLLKVLTALDGVELEVIVVRAGIDTIGADDTYLGIVTDIATISSDEKIVTLDLGTEEVEIVAAISLVTFDVDDVVEYTLNKDGEMNTKSIKVDASTLGTSVYEIKEVDGEFITITDNTDPMNPVDTTYRIASDAVVFNLNGTDDAVQITGADIQDEIDNSGAPVGVLYFVESGVVKAIVVDF
jgi:hypothetical protein